MTTLDEDDDAPASQYDFISAADWHGKPVPDRDWYIEGLIPMRQVTLLSGDGGVGKSLLALQIAAAGAMGRDVLGLSPKCGPTVHIGAEDELGEFQRRVASIADAFKTDFNGLAQLHLTSLADKDAVLAKPDRTGQMFGTQLFNEIWDFVEYDKSPRLVVLDTAADLFGGVEIDRGQVRQFIGMLRNLAIMNNCAVLLLSHPSASGMQSGSGTSGSTAWNNSVRSRLYLTRPDGRGADPDTRVLKTMKSNYGKVGGEITMRWQDGVFVLDNGKAAKNSAAALAHADRVFLEMLAMFTEEGRDVGASTSGVYAPKIMAEHAKSDGLSKADFKAAMDRQFQAKTIKLVEEGPTSKRRKRLRLA